MAAGAVSRIIRGSGRLIVGPSTAFATTAYPHGGTEIGLTKDVVLTPVGIGKRIWSEGLGDFTDSLEPTSEWVMSCLLRGWDDDGLAQFFAGNRTAGGVTQHGVFTAPGRVPGTSGADSINLVLAYVPDDLINSRGFILYRGVPYWTDEAELAFQKRTEFGIPLVVHCLQNSSSNTLQIGPMPDLSLT